MDRYRDCVYTVALRRAMIVCVELSGVRVFVNVFVGLRYAVGDGNVGVSVILGVWVVVDVLDGVMVVS